MPVHRTLTIVNRSSGKIWAQIDITRRTGAEVERLKARWRELATAEYDLRDSAEASLAPR